MEGRVPKTADARASIVLRSSVVPTVFESGAVLLDLTTKFFYSVNSSGWAILQLIETSAAAPAAIIERCKTWGMPFDEVASVVDFIDQMRAFELLEAADCAIAPEVQAPLPWTPPTIVRQEQPLHRLVTSAFDPSIPLAE